uniref:UL54 ICP27 regulatory protein n=1 Tax=Meleagrid herpesvirus 1 TaxID=37108 RepID=Q9E1F3_MEHV1|nr:UL54 ICP27 regulatory protein [Meleagrid alphaherpesvirus 1]
MSTEAFSCDSEDLMSLLDYDLIKDSSSDESNEVELVETSPTSKIPNTEELFAAPCSQERQQTRPSTVSPASRPTNNSGPLFVGQIREMAMESERRAEQSNSNGAALARQHACGPPIGSPGNNLRVSGGDGSECAPIHKRRRAFNLVPRTRSLKRTGARESSRCKSPKHHRHHDEVCHKRRATGERHDRKRRCRDRSHELSGDHVSRHKQRRSSPGSERFSSQRSSVYEELNLIFSRGKRRLKTLSSDCDFRVSSKNRWASVLAFAANSEYALRGPHITWHCLLDAGPELRRTFEIRAKISALACAARESVLRGESFIGALGSAEETLSWLKMHATLHLILVNHDPIFKTAGAVLDNLRLKLAPILMCRYNTEKRSMEDMLRRSSPEDITDSLTMCLIMLSRIRRTMRTAGNKYSYMIDPMNRMSNYTPGECMTGILRHIDEHARRCPDHICNLYITCTLMPMYVHGRYFYCNSFFC